MFVKLTKIYVGAAYYPELWNLDEVDKDIERCKSLGINVLRIAEFAWGAMEPKEGFYTFDWLQTVLDKCYAAGISVVLCTPTCTPPRWLLDKYAETRRVNSNGERVEVNSRCHVCKTSTVAREKNREIVTKMAQLFGKHPAVIGWQLDNEIFPYDGGCFCENCKKAFRFYLKEKYGTIENLNKSIGLARWSLCYLDFDEVLPPKNDWLHPALRKLWFDFQCRQICTYLWEQADVIRKYSMAPVGTDMMPHNLLSYYKVNEKLDIIQYNHYDSYDKLWKTAFAYDFLRPIKDRPFWVTETQVGWNGSEYAESGYRPMGNCYANTWLPVAKGAEANMYWLFRTHPNGHEIGHGALYATYGREYRVTDEVRKACEDMAKCQDFLAETKVKSTIAMHYSSVAANLFRVQPLAKNLDYRETLAVKVYKAFADHHVNVDVIDVEHSLDDYSVLYSPFLLSIGDELAESIESWVKNGGTWIVGPMSGVMTDDGTKDAYSPYPLIEKIGGVRLKYQKPIDNDVFTAKWSDGSACKISTWFDAFECEGAKSLAKYSDGEEFGGLSVVCENTVGNGKIIVLGSLLSTDDLFKLSGVYSSVTATENLTVVERTGKKNGFVVVEHSAKQGNITLNKNYRELLSEKTLTGDVIVEPYKVLVLEEI